MKKLLVFVMISFAGLFTANAQELGLRFGDISGGAVAIDGIFATGDFSRIHADVSFGSGGVGIDAAWDFLYRPIGEEPISWYVGAGPYMFIGDDFNLGVFGEVGIEYTFNTFPISLSFDYRPSLEIIDNTQLHWGGFGFNVRYVFNK